jgi:hypothetical protein
VREPLHRCHLPSCAGDGPVNSCRSRLSLVSIHFSLTMRRWIQVASMENSRCPEGPDRNTSSRGRARSSRTGCRSARAFFGWSGIKICRPNLTSIPPGWRAWTALASSESAGTRSCGVPKNAQNRGAGAQARLHTVAQTRRAARRRCGHPIRFGDPGCSRPEHHSWGVPSEGVPSEHSFPQQWGRSTHAIAAGRSLPLGLITLRANQATQPIRSAVCQTSGDESGGLLPPPAPRSRTCAA